MTSCSATRVTENWSDTDVAGSGVLLGLQMTGVPQLWQRMGVSLRWQSRGKIHEFLHKCSEPFLGAMVYLPPFLLWVGPRHQGTPRNLFLRSWMHIWVVIMFYFLTSEENSVTNFWEFFLSDLHLLCRNGSFYTFKWLSHGYSTRHKRPWLSFQTTGRMLRGRSRSEWTALETYRQSNEEMRPTLVTWDRSRCTEKCRLSDIASGPCLCYFVVMVPWSGSVFGFSLFWGFAIAVNPWLDSVATMAPLFGSIAVMFP